MIISPVSDNCHSGSCVVTVPDTSAKGATQNPIVSMVWPPTIVKKLAPFALSPIHASEEGRLAPPAPNIVTFTATT